MFQGSRLYGTRANIFGQNKNIHEAAALRGGQGGLPEFDLGALDVIAGDALERPQIVVRIVRWLYPCERRRRAAFVTTRPLEQDHLVDWLCGLHTGLPCPMRAGARPVSQPPMPEVSCRWWLNRPPAPKGCRVKVRYEAVLLFESGGGARPAGVRRSADQRDDHRDEAERQDNAEQDCPDEEGTLAHCAERARVARRINRYVHLANCGKYLDARGAARPAIVTMHRSLFFAEAFVARENGHQLRGRVLPPTPCRTSPDRDSNASIPGAWFLRQGRRTQGLWPDTLQRFALLGPL
jgi:hypothetical protein